MHVGMGWNGKKRGREFMAVTELDRLTLPPGARLLGLDLGEKTIGVALLSVRS